MNGWHKLLIRGIALLEKGFAEIDASRTRHQQSAICPVGAYLPA